MRIEIKKENALEWCAFLLFAVGYIVISYFHEPWFDEAQAWQIAKYASYKDILTYIPHYEGHPPLWHLILSIPAKLGIPYELGLKSVGFIISISYTALLIFQSPFPRIVRLLLPFNFFLFYQYGVIVRPYGLLMLIFLIMAMSFKKRNKHPWQFIGTLMLLCMAHSYGIMIAGGIAGCVVWDLIQEKGIKRCFREVFSDPRTQALLALLTVAIVLIAEIIPYSDTYIASRNARNTLFERILCMLFAAIPECFLICSDWFGVDTLLLQTVTISLPSLISAIIVGLILWLAIVLIAPRRMIYYFVVPYLLFCSFGAIVYMTAHHIGVVLGLLLFWLWIISEAGECFAGWEKTKTFIQIDKRSARAIRRGISLVGIGMLIIPVYWSAASSFNDVRYQYSYGRGLASFLKDTGLESCTIFASCTDPSHTVDEELMLPVADPTILAYFDKNIFSNTGDSTVRFKKHQTVTQQEYMEQYEQWKKLGVPEVLFGYSDLSLIYGDDATIWDYSVVYYAQVNYAFKNGVCSGGPVLLVRNDFVEMYGLSPLDTSGMLLQNFGLTPEMREAYLNGTKTKDEILASIQGD